jgi:hypothetical protein
MANVVIKENTQSERIKAELQIYGLPQQEENEEEARKNASLLYLTLAPYMAKLIRAFETALNKASTSQIDEFSFILSQHSSWLEWQIDELVSRKKADKISYLFQASWIYFKLAWKSFLFEAKKWLKRR